MAPMSSPDMHEGDDALKRTERLMGRLLQVPKEEAMAEEDDVKVIEYKPEQHTTVWPPSPDREPVVRGTAAPSASPHPR